MVFDIQTAKKFSFLQGAQEDTAAALDARECGAGCSAGRPTR